MSDPAATQNAPPDQVQSAAPVAASPELPTTATESPKDATPAAAPEPAIAASKSEAATEVAKDTKEAVTVTEDAPKVDMTNSSTAPAPATPATAAAEAKPEISAAPPSPTPGAPAALPAASEKKDETEDKEPQNTLTGHFTEAEWKALKDFRAQLPDILAEAFPDKPEAQSTPFTIWGVVVDPTKPKSDARVSVILMKFLRARNLNSAAAREMLVNTLRWRESFDIEAALKEEFPKDLFDNMGIIYGRDKGNRPVVYNIYGGNQDLKAVFSDVQRFIRWRVALQERSVALLDFTEVDQTLQIHDYAGVSLSSRDANSKAAASESTNIFGSHYPELLYKKFFINVPSWMTWIFWAFKTLIPSATFAKMAVVGSSTSSLQSALLPHIDAKELPKRYGGDAEAF